MTASEPPKPPAEGELIRVAREALALSADAAAARTPVRIQGTRWRQLERGWERARPLKLAPAPARTLAHMAHTVGVTPEQLDDVQREDAAEILRAIQRQEEAGPPATVPDLTDRHERAIMDFPGVSDEARARMIELVREIRREQGGRRRHG